MFRRASLVSKAITAQEKGKHVQISRMQTVILSA